MGCFELRILWPTSHTNDTRIHTPARRVVALSVCKDTIVSVTMEGNQCVNRKHKGNKGGEEELLWKKGRSDHKSLLLKQIQNPSIQMKKTLINMYLNMYKRDFNAVRIRRGHFCCLNTSK